MNKIKQKSILAAAVLACSTGMSANALAANDTMMDLLKALRDNGTIDAATYSILLNSAKADEEKTTHETKKVAEAASKDAVASVSSAKGNWSDRIKLKGDVRLRAQNEERDTDATSRTRGRVRYRLGVIGKINDQFEAGAGLASGGGDQRSTNQTFDNSFSTKGINLDYAYVQWKPVDFATIIAGKFKRKPFLWAPTDLIWDGDINPEGLSANFAFKNSLGKLFLNTGVWALEEFDQPAKDDPHMFYGQIGQKFKSDNVFGTGAISYYSTGDVEGNALTGSGFGASNTLVGGNLASSYDNLVLSGELGVDKVFAGRYMVAGFFDYVENTDVSAEDTGFAVGIKIGDKKVKKPGQWQLKYIYADLEQDAVLDILPDSDRFGGRTGIKSHEIALKYQAWEKVQLGLDYYDSENQLASPNVDEHILQADLLVKF